MSKITNDGLTRSGTGCFIAVIFDIHHMATVGVKGLMARVFTGETCLAYYLEPVYWKHSIIVTLC